MTEHETTELLNFYSSLVDDLWDDLSDLKSEADKLRKAGMVSTDTSDIISKISEAAGIDYARNLIESTLTSNLHRMRAMVRNLIESTLTSNSDYEDHIRSGNEE